MKSLNTKKYLLILFTFAVANCNFIYANPTSLLWEVKPKSDTTKVAYLLGSVHIAPPEMYPLHPVIMDAWKKCNALAVELNIMDLDASSLMGDMTIIFKFISLTEKLSDKLPNDLYLKVKEAFLKNEIPEEVIDMMTPLGASIFLGLGDLSSMLLDINEADSPIGIDMFFLMKAKDENKPIFELETIATQIAALESINDNIVPYLQSQIKNMDNPDADINSLFTAWKNGDADAIERMINIPPTDNKAINDKIMNAMLYDRNISMAKKIEEYLTDIKTFFIVVGAGHYVGDKSIIDILQKTGKYHIKRL